MEERERACDEEVLLLGRDPQIYAEGILKICELYLESPLPCVAGVTGANLKKRIEEIMSKRSGLKLSFAKKIALAAVGVATLTTPIILGMLNAPAILAQSARTQSSPAPWPKFELASIKSCKAGDITFGGRGGGSRVSGDLGRLRVECQTVEDLIRWAYLGFANGKAWPKDNKTGMEIPPVSERLIHQPIQGSPAWVKSDRYTIDAKPEGPETMAMMRGPMMQALLEDRFKLKIHRETREVPIYALVVAKGGPKLQATSNGSCTSIDLSGGPAPGPGLGQPQPCGFFRPVKNGGMETLGQTIAGLCAQFSAALDRDVINKTGIAGCLRYPFGLGTC
jgi:hypothetical protein